MNRKPRRFGMGDLMILIAALGAALTGARSIWLGLVSEPLSWPPTPTRLMLAILVSASATPLTLACLVFRIRQPRPPWRRVALQPGTTALIACSLIFAARMVEVGAGDNSPAISGWSKNVSMRFNDYGDPLTGNSGGGNRAIETIVVNEFFTLTVAGFIYPCGYAVGAVWLVLAVSGRWRPEKSWIDRLGRGLGVVWIALSILTAL